MKKIVKIILICVSLSFLLIILPLTAWSSTRSYLVTEGLTLNPAPVHGVGNTVWTKNTNVDFTQRGRVVVSSKPDGTGNLDIGEGMQIYNISSFQNMLVKGSEDCINFHSNIPPIDITNMMTTHIDNGANNNVTISFGDFCGGIQHISPIYIVNTDLPDPAPEPFLDLPWDYESKGLSFNEAALSMSSYFDHEFPLLGNLVVESQVSSDSVVIFNDSRRQNKAYSSHNGYDWAAQAKAKFGDNVLAAAEGEATYINTCLDCGNMIFIDHINGYRTIYMHLQKDGLITDIPGQKVHVLARQPIGKVGATGHVMPEGKDGAHIHFGVVQDKNKDGSFEGEQPWGLTDPFGWQASGTDPWEVYTTTVNNEQKTGNKSYYLWKNKTDSLKQKFDQQGGTFKAGKNTIVMPKFAMNQQVTLDLKSAPQVKINETQESIGSILVANIIHASGSFIHFLLSPYTLSMEFSGFDMNRYKDDSLAIYSSEDGVNWQRENTTVDLANKKATITISHMSYFALVGERKDIIPPTTAASLNGTQGDLGWYRSDVVVSLAAQDNINGAGIEYTLYRLDEGEWNTYTNSITVAAEGHHKLQYYSEDNDGNVEDVKVTEFDIDKTPPEIIIEPDPENEGGEISGHDNACVPRSRRESIGRSEFKHIFTDKAGNSITFFGKEYKQKSSQQIDIVSILYNGKKSYNFRNAQIRYSYQNDKKGRNLLKQEFDDDENEFTSDFDPQSRKTKFYSHTKGKSTQKVTNDKKILKVFTERGNLKYSY